MFKYRDDEQFLAKIYRYANGDIYLSIACAIDFNTMHSFYVETISIRIDCKGVKLKPELCITDIAEELLSRVIYCEQKFSLDNKNGGA